MTDIQDQIAAALSELDHLRSKDKASEEMIALLKNQNELQAMEMSKMTADHAIEVRTLKQRCDLAVRRETEIRGILDTVAASIVSGIRKMDGDKTPEQMPEAKLPVASHELLPKMEVDPYAPHPYPGSFNQPPQIRYDTRRDDLDAEVRQLVRSLPGR